MANGAGGGLAFPIDPFEAEGSLWRDEQGVDGADVAGVDAQLIEWLDGSEGNGFGGAGGGDAGDFFGDGAGLEEAAAVAFEGNLLEPASAQHEEDEDGDEVEVFEGGNAGEPAIHGACPGGEDAEGDGGVHVEETEAQGEVTAGGEVAAADEQGEGGGAGGDDVEPGREHEVAVHAEVGGKAEGHGVHGESGAESEALVETAGFDL